MFPEFRRGRRNGSTIFFYCNGDGGVRFRPRRSRSLQPIKVMDYWGSLDPPFMQKSGDISPKDHNFECSSCLENLQSLQEHLISHLDPTIMGFSSLLANSRLNLLRVDDARNLLGHLGLLQTTITGFQLFQKWILVSLLLQLSCSLNVLPDVTIATALVHYNAFVRSSASCTG
ncbi:hypothetical protein ACFX1S_041938 [Malus domestica]